MTDIQFLRAAELRGMDRTGTFLAGAFVGFCVGVVAVTLALVSL